MQPRETDVAGLARGEAVDLPAPPLALALLDSGFPMFAVHRRLDAVLERERQGSTFLNEGVALPHARIEGLRTSQVAIGIARRGISDVETEVPIECVFLILSPTRNSNEMIELLALLSRAIRDRRLTKKFREAEGTADVVRAIWDWESEQNTPQ